MILRLMGLLKYKINRTKLLILTTISIIFTFLFLGTSLDEDGDTELFFKRKPTLINSFNSPVYRKRYDSTYVFSEKDLKEEKLYQEYSVNKKSSILFLILPLINLQMGFTFLSAFLLDSKNKYNVNIIQLLIHIVLCILFTLYGIFIYLFAHELIDEFVILTFIVLFNLVILLFINKFKNIKNFVVNLFMKVF